MKKISEDRLTQECYLWFHNEFPSLRGLLFHVPNGGARNAREGAKFKSMGVWKGVADFLFMYQSTTIAIELKTSVGFLSKEQKAWRDKIGTQGFEYKVVRSLEEFKNCIKEIIS